MFIHVTKCNKKILLLLGILGVSVLFFVKINEAVLFLSQESKNAQGGEVYNKLIYFPGSNQDNWMMNQSHQGQWAGAEKWDRLAIIIDKTTEPKSARFFQLPPGELVWSEDLLNQKINYRVSCFLCHSNGPRAIRPKVKDGSMDFLTIAKITFWNLRIKTYGRIVEDKVQMKQDQRLQIPFRLQSKIDNEVLEVKICARCHKEKGFFARGRLTRQNAMAIHFMMENKLMPPYGRTLSETEKNQINYFIQGL